MRKTMLTLAIAAVAALGACSRTDDGDLEVETPRAEVEAVTDTVRTPDVNMPDVDVGMTRDTLIVNRPTVDVNRDTSSRP